MTKKGKSKILATTIWAKWTLNILEVCSKFQNIRKSSKNFEKMKKKCKIVNVLAIPTLLNM